MAKAFKRIVAGGMALIMMSILTVSANAVTISNDVYWDIDYTQNAPSSVSKYDCVRIVGPFPKEFYIDCCELSGIDPSVVVKSDVFPLPVTMGGVGSYQLGLSSGTSNKAFELHFYAGSPRTKANGYVYD